MHERGDRPSPPNVVEVAPLGIAVERSRSGAVVITLQGRLDARTAPLFDDRLREAVDPARPPRVVVLDLTALTALTGAGLDALLALYARIGSTGGRVELLDPSPAVVLLLHDAVQDVGPPPA